MTREIKFRVWDKITEKMGDVINIAFTIDGEIHHVEFICEDKIFVTMPLQMKLMQFTGFIDREGKDIYEGDIVIDKNGRKYPIYFDDGSFYGGLIEFPDIYFDLQVIGNIFENLDLSEPSWDLSTLI